MRPARLTATLATVILAASPLVLIGNDADAGPAPKGTHPGYDVLFVRHAHTTYPVPEEELSPRGIEQASALVDRFRSAPIRSVDSSIMVRAYQTADGVAADHDVPVLADEDIREVQFDLTGMSPAEQLSHYHDVMTAWLHGEERDNDFGGEGYDEVAERWNRWWETYVREHRSDKGAGVVVAHAAIFTLMLPETCSNQVDPDFAFEHGISNTGVIKAHLDPNGTLTCTEWDGVAMPSAG